jgi:hypothetical protein
MIPYIGIYDFRSRGQTLETASFFQELCLFNRLENRKLMVGVMMSFKTLNDWPTKWAEVWPKKEAVKNIFIDHPLVFNTLRYQDYGTNINLWYMIEAASTYGGEYLHAVQFDMIWPSPVLVARFHKRLPKIEVVLEVNSEALDRVMNQPDQLVNKLRTYRNSLNCVLLNKNQKGLGMNAETLLPFVRAISEHLPNLGLAVEGGLGLNTLHLVEPLVKEFPNISFNAKEKIRPSGNAMDPVDQDMAYDYLDKSVQMLSC